MIAISEDSLHKIKDILNKTIPNCEVRAFGSRVNGTNREYSDLDLAIVGEKRLGISVLGDVQEAFMESTIPFRVDVLDYNAVSEKFRKIIDAKYELIFTSSQSPIAIAREYETEALEHEVPTNKYTLSQEHQYPNSFSSK